jgi:hypothetical protein
LILQGSGLRRHDAKFQIESLPRAGAPCRFLIANHIALHGDDGAEAVPVRFDLDRVAS